MIDRSIKLRIFKAMVMIHFQQLAYKIFLSLCVFALFFLTHLTGEEYGVVVLRGYLGADQIALAKKEVENALQQEISSLVLEINSNGGDLQSALDLAKQIYEAKADKNFKMIVYIDDKAVGPSAIFPLLADELYISRVASWGDIPLGSEKAIPTNILRNRVLSLIFSENPHAEILTILASAMTDPSIQIYDDKGWKIASEASKSTKPTLSTPGEVLVVNHVQLKSLGLVKEIMNLEKFQELYPFESTKSQAKSVSSGEVLVSPVSKEKLESHIKFTEGGPNTIGLIEIVDKQKEINQSTWLYVKKALEYYKDTKPIFVILKLDTPGGEVFAAEKISDALREFDTQNNIPVIAFIDNWAMSAGAMLAYSCRYIAIVKDASMGAAEPITIGESGQMQSASEKVNSALRTDFANRAQFFDRNPYLAEAMVDKDTILVFRHGKVVKLDSESQIKSTGPNPDVLISPKGKLLTLNAEQLMKYGVADLLVMPAKLTALTDEEKEKGKWPFAKIALSEDAFLKKIPHAIVDTYQMDWKTRFFALLASPMVASMLFLGMILGFYIEINSPGFGVPGSIALTCLFLIVLSSFSLEIANWLELILLLVGITTILVELFVLPTFGLLGFIGIICFLAGLFGMMLPGAGSVSYEYETHTFNAAGEVFFERLAWLCGTLVLAFILIALLARYVTPSLGVFNRFVLSGHEQEGYLAVDSPSSLPKSGTKGEVVATLRPAGKVLIEGTIYDAISSGGFIEEGTSIVVSRIEGSSIVVEMANQGELNL
jgi:membrane-bound ClpP family serine protease